MRQRLNELYAKYTGQAIEEIEKAMDRDKFLEADEAKAFGIIDEVFDKRPDWRGRRDGRGGCDACLSCTPAKAGVQPISQRKGRFGGPFLAQRFRLLSRSVTRSTDEAASLSVVGSLTSHAADPHGQNPFPSRERVPPLESALGGKRT